MCLGPSLEPLPLLLWALVVWAGLSLRLTQAQQYQERVVLYILPNSRGQWVGQPMSNGGWEVNCGCRVRGEAFWQKMKLLEEGHKEHVAVL